jgi:hypothetical protein
LAPQGAVAQAAHQCLQAFDIGKGAEAKGVLLDPRNTEGIAAGTGGQDEAAVAQRMALSRVDLAAVRIDSVHLVFEPTDALAGKQ